MSKNKINILTNREKEILKFVSQGYNNKYIANILCVQHCTIKNTLINIYNKLGLPIKGNTINRVLATLIFHNIDIEEINK